MEKEKIRAIELTNIQKHKHVTLSLSDINVLIGETESGKTSILRGLLWNMLNNTSGEKLLNNDGAKTCSSTVVCGNDTITRYWSKSENYYTLNDKKFSAIRTSVPKEISEIYGIDTVNVQRRRDVPFMVYYKDTECAKQFGDMLDVSEIDRTVSASNSRVKDLKSHCDSLLSAINTNKEKIDSLSWTKMAENEFKDIKKHISEFKASKEKYSTYYSLYNEIIQAKDQLSKYDRLPECIKQLTVAMDVSCHNDDIKYAIEKYTRMYRSMVSCTQDYNKYNALTDAVDHYKELRVVAESIVVKITEGRKLSKLSAEIKRNSIDNFNGLDSAISEFKLIENVQAEMDAIEKQSRGIFVHSTGLNVAMSDVTRMEKRYNDLKDKFTSMMPEVCPLCGNSCEEHK